MEDTYDVYKTITHPRTFEVEIFFHAWYKRRQRFERVKYVPLDRKSELRIIYNATGCNRPRLLDINKNVTGTHSSGILPAWNTRDVI